MPTFKEAIEGLSTALAEALDGGKTATARKNKQLDVVMRMLRQLANYVEHYVEANYKDNMTIFLLSGFEAASNSRPGKPPLSESIRRIEAGSNSGCLLITIIAVLGAASYQLRWALVGTSEADGEWAMQPISQVRPATEIKNLIPGATYAFQVRALIKSTSTFTDWSDSVTRICT
jgi:hypothetical protein